MQSWQHTCAGWIVVVVGLGLIVPGGWAQSQLRGERLPTYSEWQAAKKFYDDPRPLLQGSGDPKNYLPASVYKQVSFDVAAMQDAWAEVVGFRSPAVVGKIAPEIQPGTYRYQEKDNYPFKELMLSHHYHRFKPGGPPHIGNFPVIKVVPTRQYYWSLPIAEATKKHRGTTKLTAQGYFVPDSYTAGLPFPQPEGPFKPQQILYNWMKRYMDGENTTNLQFAHGYDKKLSKDWETTFKAWFLKTNGRVLFEPFGWYDDRAKNEQEERIITLLYLTPQDSAGNALSTIYYDTVEKQNRSLLYFNEIRRLRQLSSEDTQDPFPGLDIILDDAFGFAQKLSPERFPYTYEVIAEREYLVPSYTWDGSMYFTSQGIELHNAEWERRPMYVLQLIQQDPNYIYSKRLLYFDKETFLLLFAENYDRKGQLYRVSDTFFAFYPHQGIAAAFCNLEFDHIDVHSTRLCFWVDPFAYWVTRKHTGMGQLMRAGK